MDQQAFLTDAINKGLTQDRAEGAMSAYFSPVNDGILSSRDAARRGGMTEEEFEVRRQAGMN